MICGRDRLIDGISFQSSPFDIAVESYIANGISKKKAKQQAEKLVVAKVKYSRRVATLDEGLLNPEAEAGKTEDDQWYFWDINRKLEGDC